MRGQATAILRIYGHSVASTIEKVGVLVQPRFKLKQGARVRLGEELLHRAQRTEEVVASGVRRHSLVEKTLHDRGVDVPLEYLLVLDVLTGARTLPEMTCSG